PYLLGFLGSSISAEDKRTKAMSALVRMETDVVVPLCAALSSDDAVLRRNIAMTLGSIGDQRAGAWLLWLAQSDPDDSVKNAAHDAVVRMRAPQSDASRAFCGAGEDYLARRDSVLRDQDWSDVAWDWKDGKLVSTPIPRALYADEMARNAFYHGLLANPGSVE